VSRPVTQHHTVNADQVGIELDEFLCRLFPFASKRALRQRVRDGSVLVDGAPTMPARRLGERSVVSVEFDESELEEAAPVAAQIEMPPILFEDAHVVVLDKAPFPVPSDPIVQARAEALTLAGESPFTRLHLPLAQLALKQGFGRLIRNQSDYGVVALLDTRVHRRGYGQRLLSGLPPAPRVTRLEEVAAFWQKRLPGLPVVEPPVRLRPLPPAGHAQQ